MFLFAVAGEKGKVDVAALQKQYEKEQAKLDLELLKLQREFESNSKANASWSALLSKWQVENAQRLRDQSALASHLDQVSPLPVAPVPAMPPVDESTMSQVMKDAKRMAKQVEDGAMQSIQGLTDSQRIAEKLDEWKFTNKNQIEELKAKQREAGDEQWKKLSSVIIETPEDALPEEEIAAEIEAQLARGYLTLRQVHPNATKEQIQGLLLQQGAAIEERRNTALAFKEIARQKRRNAAIQALENETSAKP